MAHRATLTLLCSFAFGGCGDRKGGVGDLADAAPETVEVADAEIRPDTAVETTWQCGVSSAGTYRGSCEVAYEEDSISTLCDETTHTCVAPHANCAGGWCLIPARSFQGGATEEVGLDNIESEPRAMMNVPRSFYMMETEVPFSEFEEVVGYLPDTDLRCGDDCPVSGVNIFEAMNFANALSDRDGLPRCYELSNCTTATVEWELILSARVFACQGAQFAGPECRGYRLPSGREYELAARAGSPYCLSRGRLTRVPTVNDCGPRDAKSWAQRLATFCGNSGSITNCPMHCIPDAEHPDFRCATNPFTAEIEGSVCLSPQAVRSREPNPFGLYGMNGNISEWTQSSRDWARDHLFEPVSSEPTNSVASTPEFTTFVDQHSYMLTTGIGYWYNVAANCGNSLYMVNENLAKIAKRQLFGFRLVRTADQ